MKKTIYTSQEYKADISIIVDMIKQFKNPHLVSLYRGALPMGVLLSNIMDLPLSIIDYQTRDTQTLEPKLIKDAGIVNSTNDTIIILDDIIDSYRTLKAAKNYMNSLFPDSDIVGITLHKNTKNEMMHANSEWVRSLNNTNGDWVVYEQWEVL